jgi:hypothetical protein
MEVAPMVAVVTDPSDTMIAADPEPRNAGIGRYTTVHKRLSVSTTAHKWLSVNTTIHKRLSGTATVHKRAAARHSTPGKAGTSAEAVSAEATAAAATTTASPVTASAATTAVPGCHGASRNRRNAERNHCR